VDILAGLERLQRVLVEFDQLPRRVAMLAAPAITKALQKEFTSGNDPHGRKWKKLATGKPSHLTLSGKLRKGTRAALMPGGRKGLRIILGAKYGSFHQTGTRTMPARRILPDKGMPASWRTALERAHREVFQQIVTGAG
jgi:phage gpG-like protein